MLKNYKATPLTVKQLELHLEREHVHHFHVRSENLNYGVYTKDIGSHITVDKGLLQVDLSLFYMEPSITLVVDLIRQFHDLGTITTDMDEVLEQEGEEGGGDASYASILRHRLRDIGYLHGYAYGYASVSITPYAQDIEIYRQSFKIAGEAFSLIQIKLNAGNSDTLDDISEHYLSIITSEGSDQAGGVLYKMSTAEKLTKRDTKLFAELALETGVLSNLLSGYSYALDDGDIQERKIQSFREITVQCMPVTLPVDGGALTEDIYLFREYHSQTVVKKSVINDMDIIVTPNESMTSQFTGYSIDLFDKSKTITLRYLQV